MSSAASRAPHTRSPSLLLPQTANSASPRNVGPFNKPGSWIVTKKDVEAGKSGSFDGSVSEWLDILFNALFSLDGDCGEGRKNGDDVAISAQISRRKDILSVLASLRVVLMID